MSEFKVSEEETQAMFSKQYELLQKQWKEHTDRLLAERQVSHCYMPMLIFRHLF